MYDLGFAEINMQLDQQHFQWGGLTISQVKYEKKKFPSIIWIIKLAAYSFQSPLNLSY